MPLSHADLLKLKRWNTPTIYNGWEQITQRDAGSECFNREETRDYMPQMGPMIGYAVTVVIEPSVAAHKGKNPNALREYLEYVAETPGPKIVVAQDLDKPNLHGALWGEVGANIHRSLGCVGTIIDGGIRDVDEMTNAGFKALARRLCVGHAHVCHLRWNCPVDVFGITIQPGQLIHADKHGFLAIPPEDEARLLEASLFMDDNECNTVIPVGRDTTGKSQEQIIDEFIAGAKQAGKNAQDKFHSTSEWE